MTVCTGGDMESNFVTKFEFFVEMNICKFSLIKSTQLVNDEISESAKGTTSSCEECRLV